MVVNHRKVEPYRDCEAGRHTVQVVRMFSHSHDFWDDGLFGPVYSKDLGELLQILCSCFADGEHGIAKPVHTKAGELLVEEIHAQLTSEQRNVLDDGQPDTPLLVLGQLNDCRKKGLRE